MPFEIVRNDIVNMRVDAVVNTANAGYGGMFRRWLRDPEMKAYNSFGNGSAMRVSAVAWLYDDINAVRHAARLSAEVITIVFGKLLYGYPTNGGASPKKIARNTPFVIYTRFYPFCIKPSEKVNLCFT